VNPWKSRLYELSQTLLGVRGPEALVGRGKNFPFAGEKAPTDLKPSDQLGRRDLVKVRASRSSPEESSCSEGTGARRSRKGKVDGPAKKRSDGQEDAVRGQEKLERSLS